MDEIQDILAKYDRAYLERLSASTPEADQLALAFFEDVAEILDTLSRLSPHFSHRQAGGLRRQG